MNARDNDLAQPAAADETAVTGPVSPPRRDPVEDADPSFTRKRQRLDSGSNSIRALSTDTEPSVKPAASPREQQVQMTIRSHLPSSPVSAPVEQGHDANTLPGDPQNISPILIASTDDESGSPPIMVIEEDEEPIPGVSVQIDAEDFFQQFPCNAARDYHKTVQELPQYIHGSTPIDGGLLPMLSDWLEELPEPSVDIQGLYIRKAAFWDHFSIVVNKVLARRYPFGDHFDDLQTDQIFDRFLGLYARLCSILLLVDSHVLSQHPPGEIYALPLLSHKHMRSLHNIIRFEKTPLFQVLHKEYGANVRELNTRMQKAFLTASGAQHLLRLADEAFHRVPPNTQNTYGTYTSQLLSTLGWTIFELQDVDTLIGRSVYHRGVLSFFQKYGADISDPSIPIDAGVARDLIQYYSTLVHELCQWDDTIATELVDQLLDFADPDSPTASSAADPKSTTGNDYRQDAACYPVLASNAWKFKVLRKYIVRGNMGLRVMSIATMDTALVELWREFSKIDPSCKHPVIQYLADFLLQGQVVDYIVSVDSHPQLISRSGNIAGFLVIAHRWSDNQADAVWKTVSSSPDPRVVAATMTMLRGIIGLMTSSDRLYLCTKLYELPIDRYTMDILRFFRNLTAILNENNNIRFIDYDEKGPTARPWNVCIRVIRDTAPSRHADKNLLDLQTEAFDHLRYLIAAIPTTERHFIYRECAQQIADGPERATGNYRIMCLLAQYTYPDDAPFFQENKTLTRSVLGEIPAFVKREVLDGPHVCQLSALHFRLELLRLTITHPAMTIPGDLHESLWDHLLGDKALSNEARDMAWTTLLHAVKISPQDEFCSQLVLSYIPILDAQFYTSGLFEFVASYNFSVTRQVIQTEQGTNSLLQIPGADLLWPIILTAPPGTIEDRAARLLAARYVKVVEMNSVTLPEVEKAHVALVEQCMQKLRTAMEMLPKHSSCDTKLRHKSEIHVERILLFQKLLLGAVRQKPELNRGRRMDSKVDAMDTDVPYGDVVTVRYQSGNNRNSVTMASEDTVEDLYRKLCHASGFTKINLFARGQRLKVFENPAVKLSELDFGGQVIVQRADGAEQTRPLPALAAGSSVFETAIVKYFDELFAWMDSANTTSYLFFDFLNNFPTRSSLAESVAQGEALSEDLFPPGKPFQARYAALALQTRLREQIRDSALNEVFLGNAIQHLEKALLNKSLISEAFSGPEELQLAAVIVGALLEFLRERPASETSAAYFSDHVSFVNRLMKIVSVALETQGSATVAQEAYATILEAALHSRAIWETFTCHADVHLIHRMLLLAQPRETVRGYITRKIASICGGDLPSTCPITRAETASRFWAIISAILPEAVHHAEQSRQFFEIAELVFRANDEYDRNEDSLRSMLNHWSTFLLSHEHEEFPGRDQVDNVVFGLTKLLLCCILSLKSFKKPVNAGSLMEQIFRKYLFVNFAQAESASSGGVSIPLLESHTRQELYDLMLAVAEDRTTYDMLLRLAGDVECLDTDPILTGNLVDRSLEIRSSTGYVGLSNPRAICYMNSLLTQLFMNLNFRQFILELSVHEALGSQRLLFETQRLFSEMQNSFRKAADPRNFATCVKSLDKTPIDITIQMDADEFYNLIFDQWEAQLFKQEHKREFRSFYGGQTMNQIKSKECKHVSERMEPFFAVQCDIAGKANLEESLQAYVQGDVMEGDNKYKCESCGGKFVDAVKRTCLKDAPDNLIFHLKRFEFDLNDFSRKKIYDHFAFPETLDISPYKFEHLAEPTKPRQEDLFDLVGVLVHTGTCENGHYYSYIRQRPGPSESTTPTWIEFNDSEVGPFDPSEIADRTFGGFTEGDGYTRQIKQYSAYMLFYQRRSAVEEDQRHWVTTSTKRTPQITIPKFFEAEVNANNDQFVREYSLFDSAHAKFVRHLHGVSRTVNQQSCSEDHDQETRAIHIVVSQLGHIAWRQHDADTFLELLLHVRKSMMACSTCCSIALRCLAEDDDAMTNILIRCTHAKVRYQTRAVLIDSLKFLREQDPALYGAEPNDSDMEVYASAPTDGTLVALIKRLRSTADETWESTRGWEDYYLTLTQIAEMGQFETAVLLNHNFLHFGLSLFCMNAYAPYKNEAPELARIMDKRRGIFNRLICFLWKLLSQMDLTLPTLNDNQSHDRMATLDRERMKFPLSRRETVVLGFWSNDLNAIVIVDKILEAFDDAKVDHFYPGDIVKWMLESPRESIHQYLFQTMLEGVQLDPPYCNAYIQASLPYCEACSEPANIRKVIDTISQTIASPNRAADDRLPSGHAVLRFFAGLLKAENEEFFYQKHPHAFHHCLMSRSNMYGVTLLCHIEERVRKNTYIFFQKLYGNDEAIPTETAHMKYKSARELLVEIMHRFVYEREIGQHRSFMVPMVDTGRLLVEQLCLLCNIDEPEAQQFQDINDAALITQFQNEVEARMRSWPHDMDTPISQGETFEQSDYGTSQLSKFVVDARKTGVDGALESGVHDRCLANEKQTTRAGQKSKVVNISTNF